MTDNELIEEFYVLHGGKPHMAADIHFYESSWDMLMPVVEKIGDTWDLNEFGTASEKVLKLPISSHIQQVYNAVVEFIKWYNENK